MLIIDMKSGASNQSLNIGFQPKAREGATTAINFAQCEVLLLTAQLKRSQNGVSDILADVSNLMPLT